MSDRLKAAITYGVLSLVIFGIALGLTLAGSEWAERAWLVLISHQGLFGFFAIGYSGGRGDQREGRVK